MQIKATLSPIGSKKLDETIVNLVDTHFDGGIQKFGIKYAWGVAGIFGQDGKNTLLAWARGFFEDFVKNTLKENNIYATVEKLDISIDHEDLNISLVADNIDYTKSITKNTKRIIDGLKKISPDNVAWGIIDILGKEKNDTISALLNSINDKKKESIIKLLIKEYHSNLCEFLTKLLVENKNNLSVKNISIT